MKKLLVLLLSLLMVLGLAACSSGEKPAEGGEEDELVVGLAIHNQTIEFTITLYETLKEDVEAMGGRLIMSDANSDASKQVNQIEDFVTQQVDYIVVCPVDSMALGGALQTANDAGIPVINLDSAVTDEDLDKVVTVISSDNEGGGKAVGEWLAANLPENAIFGIINYPQVQAIDIRTQAMINVLNEKRPDVTQLYHNLTSDETANIAGYFENTITANPGICGFFTVMDSWGLTCYEVCQTAGIENPVVIGFDGSPAGKQAIRDGKYSATCVNSCKSLAHEAAKVIETLQNGGTPEKAIATSMWVIDKANVEEYGYDSFN